MSQAVRHEAIVARRPVFADWSELPRYWNRGEPFATHFMNALSSVFPPGEAFFVKSVLRYRDDIDDPELLARIRGFAGQEGQHSHQHDRHLELLLSSDRTSHALWNIASDAGLEVGVVNFWNTYPPERIRGVMVSDHLLASEVTGRRKVAHAAPVRRGAVVFPLDWHARLAHILDRIGQWLAAPYPA